MPSQAVATIKGLFPSMTEESRETYGFYDLPRMLTVLRLVEHVPDELMVMPEQDYAQLVASRALIEAKVAQWQSLTGLDWKQIKNTEGFWQLEARAGENPVWLIARALEQCPDEFPAPVTHDLSFIGDEAFRDSIIRDIGAIEQALHHREWKAATVLAGSAIEALLLWRLQQEDITKIRVAIDAEQIEVKAAKPPRSWNPPTKCAKASDLEHWQLQHYIPIARRLGHIGSATEQAANLGREFRNLIHPGAAQRKKTPCNRGTAYSAAGALQHVVIDLGANAK
jgi:hypothetical protein